MTTEDTRPTFSSVMDANARPAAIQFTIDVITSMKIDPQVHNVVELIGKVHGAISALYGAAPAAEPERKNPAVSIAKSITPEFLICLEDGLKFKSLKRHLRTLYNLTPEQYRERWGLKPDYPMVAPSYSEKRSQLAKDNGLGKKRAA